MTCGYPDPPDEPQACVSQREYDELKIGSRILACLILTDSTILDGGIRRTAERMLELTGEDDGTRSTGWDRGARCRGDAGAVGD